MIKNIKKKTKYAAACAVVLTIVMSLGAAAAGVYGMTNRNARNTHETIENIGHDAALETPEDGVVIKVKNRSGQRNVSESGFFAAESGQVLTLEITSTIRGGLVDLFLFAPDGTEHRFTIGTADGAIREVELTEGIWAYNVFGIFRNGGNISITGTLMN